MQTAWITGASSGIGRAVAIELHRRGWAVGLLARREAELRELAQTLGDRVAWVAVDVTDTDALAQAAASLRQALGEPDLVLANAGKGSPAPVTRLDFRGMESLFELNVLAVIHTVEQVLPQMLERGSGHIAVVSSVAGYRGVAPGSVYSATKAAVSTLFEGWRVELAPRGIAVTVVEPGFVDTPILDGAKHPTPFKVPVDRAARIVVDGLLARRRRIVFPWPMALFMRLVRVLPDALFDTLLRVVVLRKP